MPQNNLLTRWRNEDGTPQGSYRTATLKKLHWKYKTPQYHWVLTAISTLVRPESHENLSLVHKSPFSGILVAVSLL